MDAETAVTGQLLSPLRYDDSLLENTIVFSNMNGQLAEISPEGILRFTIEANDENAEKFIKCIESALQIRLTGLDVTKHGS